MAQYNFEGDIDYLNEIQVEFLNNVIQEQDLQVTKVVFSPVGQAGDNFVANVKRVRIEGDNGNLNFVIKVAPTQEMARKMSNTEFMFRNEHIMYTEVLPKLVQLQKDAGVPEEEQLRYARCYGSLTEAPYEVIILEDLSESDFVMLNKFEPLSDECVKSILKNFAILHSLSYALKKKEPETYEVLQSKLVDIWGLMSADPQFAGIMQKFEDDILTVFEEKHKNILKNKVTGMFKLAAKFAKDGVNKHSVIQQGDAWTNNVMFKVGDDSVQSIMIDYQASKNNSPAADLLYMIFNCTDHESRSKNYYNWIDYYHTELEKSLSVFDLKVNYVYSRDHLDADLKRYGKLLFGMSIMLASVLMRNSAEAQKMMDARENMEDQDLSEALESMKMETLQDDTMVRFKTRVLGLIDSFTELGLL